MVCHKRKRELVNAMSLRFYRRNTEYSGRRWILVTMNACSANEIQRCWRGFHYGRLVMYHKKMEIKYAIKIQKVWRGRQGFKATVRMMKQRQQSALLIQRVYRGYKDRVYAHGLLMEHYRKEDEKITEWKVGTLISVAFNSHVYYYMKLHPPL